MKDQLPAKPPDQSSSAPRRDRGRDLLLDVDRGAAVPLRVQIEQQLRDGIRQGRLAAETVLPSSRALAAELGTSRGVVVEAYAQLTAEGFLAARPGGATRVAEVPPQLLGLGAREAPPVPSGARAGRLDLLPMAGDLTAFPRQAWMRGLRRALDELPAPALSYGDPRGPLRARTVLADYLGRSRGVVATPGTTALTTGVTSGLSRLASVLFGRGVRRIAVEEPGFWPHRTTLEATGLEIVPVPVDEEGLCVDRLDGLDVGAVLVTPAHQAPTGRVLSAGRRAMLVRWASQRDALVIEDDYDGEFRYDRVVIGALQGLAPDHVAHLGSVSKTLAPALRIGWIVAPGPLVDAVAGSRLVAAGGTPTIEPLALAAMVEAGDYDRHLRAQRRRYAARRAAVVAAVARELPEATVLGVSAGLHVAVVPPVAVDALAVMSEAADRGLALLAVPASFASLPGRTLVTIGYGQLGDTNVDRAVRLLAEAIDAATARRSTAALP